MKQRVFPVLRILDYDTAKAYYVDGLGFGIDWEWRHEPGFPVFMGISRDGIGLFLSEHSGDAEPGGHAQIYVDDVDAWHALASERGVEAQFGPQDQAWGNREVHYRDPFGNRLTIATVLVKQAG